MKKVNWLIDADLFTEYSDELQAAISDQGHAVTRIGVTKPGDTWEDEGCSYRNTFPTESCVVTHASIGFCDRVRREQLWTPGAYFPVEDLFCSRYFGELGEFLLNEDFVMLPFCDLRRRREFLFDCFGHDGAFFVRPDSPLKSFDGQLVREASFEKDLEFLAFYEFPEHELVVVSSPKAVTTEWRFVGADRAIVAGSQYRAGGREVSVSPVCDPQARGLAETIAAREFQVDSVWVVDVGLTSAGDLRLIENRRFQLCLSLCVPQRGRCLGGFRGRSSRL